MTKTIGFIGCGNMAKAIISGMISSGFAQPENIMASNRTMPKLVEMKETYGIQITQNNLSVAEASDILFLAVKPHMYSSVINELKEYVRGNTIVISIAAGISINQVEEFFGKQLKIAKAMPNTPVAVGEGMVFLSTNSLVTDEDTNTLLPLFNSFSKTEVIDESLMDVASAVGGSSPAFVYMFIEALADGAVMYGMPRKLAYSVAAQTVFGSAKMVLESGQHPAQLKDDVCSPNGTTIQSVAALEENGFRSSIIKAVQANLKKLGK